MQNDGYAWCMNNEYSEMMSINHKLWMREYVKLLLHLPSILSFIFPYQLDYLVLQMAQIKPNFSFFVCWRRWIGSIKQGVTSRTNVCCVRSSGIEQVFVASTRSYPVGCFHSLCVLCMYVLCVYLCVFNETIDFAIVIGFADNIIFILTLISI